MIIPKKARLAIYQYLFQEGVVVAEKNLRAKHPDIDVPNLYVVKLCTSLKSREYVTENFCWNHYYYYLTNEGIEYLRETLHLPEAVVPATLRRPVGRADRGAPGTGGDRPGGDRPGGRGGDRYPGGRRFKDAGTPGSDSFTPTFEGAGRGRPPAAVVPPPDATPDTGDAGW